MRVQIALIGIVIAGAPAIAQPPSDPCAPYYARNPIDALMAPIIQAQRRNECAQARAAYAAAMRQAYEAQQRADREREAAAQRAAQEQQAKAAAAEQAAARSRADADSEAKAEAERRYHAAQGGNPSTRNSAQSGPPPGPQPPVVRWEPPLRPPGEANPNRIYHAVDNDAVGCMDAVHAGLWPKASKYGLSESQQAAFLDEGQCYPTVPDLQWILVDRDPGAYAVRMRMLNPVNGGSVMIYFPPSAMIDQDGHHPSMTP